MNIFQILWNHENREQHFMNNFRFLCNHENREQYNQLGRFYIKLLTEYVSYNLVYNVHNVQCTPNINAMH